jgi:hypothetical protein
MPDRTEGAALGGTLTVTIDGRPVVLPVLKVKHSKEWKNRLGTVVADTNIAVDDDLSVTIGRVANLASDVALDLVAAYDRTNLLGGRDAIEEQATDPELFAALETLVKVTFPFETAARSLAEAFGPQLRELMTGLLSNMAAVLKRGSSTPTRNATGGSTPIALKSDTPTSSSLSSGPTTSDPSPSELRPTGT